MPRYALYYEDLAASIKARSDKQAIEEARFIASLWAATAAKDRSAWASAQLVRLNKSGKRRVAIVLVRADPPESEKCPDGEPHDLAVQSVAGHGAGTITTLVCHRCSAVVKEDSCCRCRQLAGEPHVCVTVVKPGTLSQEKDEA